MAKKFVELNSGIISPDEHISWMMSAMSLALIEHMQTSGITYVPPEVLDPNNPEDSEKIASVRTIAKNKHPLPLNTAINEYLQLQTAYLAFLKAIGVSDQATSEELTTALRQLTSTQILKTLPNSEGKITEQKIADLLSETTTIKDLAILIKRLFEFRGTAEELKKHEARFIWNSSEKDLAFYASERLIQTLHLTRLLGLIPFEAIEKLREAKIVVFGASVAASTIDLLVALGAKQIEFIDDGELEPSNGQKMPAGKTADFRSNGQYKASILADNLYSRNPYGNFTPHKGRVVFTEEEKRVGRDDKLITELVTSNTAFVIEVVDNAQTKTKVRQYMTEHFPHIPVVFIADVGTNAFAGLEDPTANEPFNQLFTPDQKEFLDQIATQGPSSAVEQIKAILLMVKDQLPNDHKLQVMLILYGGLIHWLSQTGIAARQSASIAVSELLMYLMRGEGLGINRNSENPIISLQPELSKEAHKTLEHIFASTIA